jgi:predicted amidohydrolase
VVANLVEREAVTTDGGRENFYSTAYLISSEGTVAACYRKAHLGEAERAWATAGRDGLVVVDTPIGRIGLMIGNEVWLPEVCRILTLRGAEVISHPADWDRVEAATMAAVERTEENRTHLISCARTDNVANFGSQIVVADRFRFGQVSRSNRPVAFNTFLGRLTVVLVHRPHEVPNGDLVEDGL